MGMSQGASALQISGWTIAYLEVLICAACGLVETYVPAEKLGTVREKWERLRGSGEGPIFEGH